VLFNPQGSVVKIFLVAIDVNDMPAKSKTFIRQRTFSVPSNQLIQTEATSSNTCKNNILDATKSQQQHLSTSLPNTGNLNGAGMQKSVLKFLIHLRLVSDHRSRVFLHSDIKMLLSNKGNDLEGLEVVPIRLDASTQMPQEPKYSPIK
jgi:hypothetical protein